jgi:hypothetical protein
MRSGIAAVVAAAFLFFLAAPPAVGAQCTNDWAQSEFSKLQGAMLSKDMAFMRDSAPPVADCLVTLSRTQTGDEHYADLLAAGVSYFIAYGAWQADGQTAKAADYGAKSQAITAALVADPKAPAQVKQVAQTIRDSYASVQQQATPPSKRV